MNERFRRILLSMLIVMFITQLKLHGGQQQFYTIQNFVTQNNDTIANCIVGYRTYGELNEDSSNVVIYPTWFAGTSAQLKSLLSPERFVDSTKYFIIGIDALGNGISASPSNTENFPSITIHDMVNSQYKLLTDHFGFTKIFGAVGGSMGGMQIFEWVSAYPGFIKKAVSYVSTPQPTANDLTQWNLRLEVLKSYKSSNVSAEQTKRTLDILNELMARSSEYINEKISYEQFPEYLAGFTGKQNEIFTLENYESQMNAMLAHNIYTPERLESKPWLNSKMMLIVSKTDRLVHMQRSIEFAEKYGAEIHILDNNCGHLAIGCEIQKCSDIIRNFISN